jgi:predicted O-methyltransferase YrrM
MELLKGMITNCGEGNVSLYPERIFTIEDLITQHKPKNIIEIGFNEGHSALVICNTLTKLIQEDTSYNETPIRIFIFDICKYECTTTNFNVLQNHFINWNIHLHLFPGDSIDVVPRVLDTANTKFDFIEIDGCHLKDWIYNDIINTYNFVSDNGIIYIDDFNSSKDPHREINEVVKHIDWQGFNTYYIDGAFWAQKQITNMEENNDLVYKHMPPPPQKEQVNHPNHYGGENNPYEAIKVIDAWDLGFSLGNTVKYISRAGKKNKDKELEDLKKALWYLEHHIKTIEKK